MRFTFGLHFIDNDMGLEAVRIVQQGENRRFATRFLLESPVLYESVRPFLHTIKHLDEHRVPLQQYLVHRQLEGATIGLPRYMRDHPDRVWDLSTLLKDDSEVTTCLFSPHSQVSIANARETMHLFGKLDPRYACPVHGADWAQPERRRH